MTLLRHLFIATQSGALVWAGAMLAAQHIPAAWGLVALGFAALIMEAV